MGTKVFCSFFFFNWERASHALRFHKSPILWPPVPMLSVKCVRHPFPFNSLQEFPNWLSASHLSTITLANLLFLKHSVLTSRVSPMHSVSSPATQDTQCGFRLSRPDLSPSLHILIIPTQDDTFYKHISSSPLFKPTPMV